MKQWIDWNDLCQLINKDKMKKLFRNKAGGIITGLCQGIGEYTKLSPWIFRLLFVVPVLPFVLTNVASVVSILVYIVLSILIKDKPKRSDIIEVEYEIIDDGDSNDQNAGK